MMYCRPAGLSDEDDDYDDDDEFEFSSDYQEYGLRKQIYLEDNPESKETIFYKSLKNGDKESMKEMLANGFHIDQPLMGGWSALMHACSLGSLPMVEFLVEAQANINFNKELFTSLMALCKSSSLNEDELLKCFDILIKHGANVNAADRNACTALMYACRSGHVQLVQRLVDCKCDVNIQDTEGWSALFHAVNEGQRNIIEILIKEKARLDLIDRRRRSAYELAMQKGYDHIATLVCSKKEKQRLREVEEEENMVILHNVVTNPVDELFAQLPKRNFKSNSGFSSEVSRLLSAMRLGHFSKQFAANNVQLNEFLLITDERLKALGVRFSVHRQQILNSVRKFHLHKWSKSSLGMKPRNQQIDIEDGIKLMCNVTKHLHILNASMNYMRVYQIVPIRTEVFRTCESIVHQLNLISGELTAINLFSSLLKEREKIEPIDLIKPRQQSHKYFISFLVSGIIFFALWKSKLSISSLKRFFVSV